MGVASEGPGPRCMKPPNGDIRFNRAEYDHCMTTLEEAA
jgi:hypothetical protein